MSGHHASPIRHSSREETLDSSTLSWSEDDRPVTPTYNLDKEESVINKSNIEPKNLLGVGSFTYVLSIPWHEKITPFTSWHENSILSLYQDEHVLFEDNRFKAKQIHLDIHLLEELCRLRNFFLTDLLLVVVSPPD